MTRNKRGLQETQYGIEQRPDKRLAKHARHGWRLVDAISGGDGDEILALENLIKDAMKAEGVYRREYDEKYDGLHGGVGCVGRLASFHVVGRFTDLGSASRLA